MALKDTVNQMNKLLEQIAFDLGKAYKGNKAASQRVRTASIKFEKVAKLYRKESISGHSGKKTTTRKKPTKKASTSKKPTKKATTKRKTTTKRKPTKKATTRKTSTSRKSTRGSTTSRSSSKSRARRR